MISPTVTESSVPSEQNRIKFFISVDIQNFFHACVFLPVVFLFLRISLIRVFKGRAALVCDSVFIFMIVQKHFQVQPPLINLSHVHKEFNFVQIRLQLFPSLHLAAKIRVDFTLCRVSFHWFVVLEISFARQRNNQLNFSHSCCVSSESSSVCGKLKSTQYGETDYSPPLFRQ